jgi:hypothetical protein
MPYPDASPLKQQRKDCLLLFTPRAHTGEDERSNAALICQRTTQLIAAKKMAPTILHD